MTQTNARNASPDSGTRVRARAAAAVSAVLHRGRRLEDSLDYSELAPRDRALLRELATGTVRWAIRLRAVLDGLLDRPLKAGAEPVEALLLVGLYQIAHTRVPPHAAVNSTVGAATGKQAWARKLVNGVLRRFQREAEEHLAAADARGTAVRTAHPQWLVDELNAAYPDAWEAILAANNEPPPLTLRVDGDREGYLAELADSGIEAEADPEVATAVRLREFRPVVALPGFDEGRVSVQDAAAQRIAPLVDPHPEERILDTCAAPGGKLDHLLTLAPGVEALALDADARRLERVRETLARTGQTGAELVAADATDPDQWWDGEPFDAVLVDAPCSGTGVIRRHPDIKHLRRPDDLVPMTARQDALLDAAWSVLAPGGRLVYATCSVLPAENGERVRAFRERHPRAVLRDPRPAAGRDTGAGRQLLPGEGGGDGFFFAVLERPA